MSAQRTAKRGHITYDDGRHVCTCTESTHYDPDGYPVITEYAATVRVDRDVEPTESGSWYYRCHRCGASGWSGL